MSVTDSEARTASTPGARRLTTARAIAEGIAQEMERDSSVVVLGEDIGKYGGIFGATTGLLDQFGPERVLDTPISEPPSSAWALVPRSKACGRSSS